MAHFEVDLMHPILVQGQSLDVSLFNQNEVYQINFSEGEKK